MELNNEQRLTIYGYLSIAEAKADDLRKYLLNNYTTFFNDEAREAFNVSFARVTDLIDYLRQEENFFRVDNYEIKKGAAK